MTRFRILLFLLSLTVFTVSASFFFFDPFTMEKPHVAVLDRNCDTNPYDDSFFTPDNSGLQSSRQNGVPDEAFSAFFAFLAVSGALTGFPEMERPFFPVPPDSSCSYVKRFLSACLPVRAGPGIV